MPDGSRFFSMSVKFFGVLVVTGVGVVLGALILIPLTLQIFRNIYMRPDNVDARLEMYARQFATYVAREQVRSDDTAAVVAWTRRHGSVYLTIFSETDEGFGAAGGELWEGDDRPDMEPFFDEIIPDAVGEGEYTVDLPTEGTLYNIRFANGISSVALVDYSISTATDLIVMGGVVVALAVYFLLILFFYRRQTRAIISLSHEVEAVSGGALDGVIAVNRNDEIGLLAHDVDTMRNTIIQKMDEQNRAWQANRDLLTSMTHDLRTPLTTLMGYMELLGADSSEENQNLTEEQRTYIRVCSEKAEQIKSLSDKLFLYFWAYNRPECEMPLETVDAHLLFDQLIGDYIPAMEVAGLHIVGSPDAIPAGTIVRVQPDALHRVTDNLFDNLVKYADPSAPVYIITAVTHDSLTLRMTNTVAPCNDKSTGTRIGHRICRNMMEQMHGQFSVTTDENIFTAELTFPL